jgi:hypothetical protein
LVAVPVRDALRFKSMAATTLAAGLTTVSALNHDYIDASVDHTLEVRRKRSDSVSMSHFGGGVCVTV